MHSIIAAAVFGISVLQRHSSLMHWFCSCHLMTSPLPSYFRNSLLSNYYFMPLFNSLVFNISSLTSLFQWCEKNGANFIIYLINSGLRELNFIVPFSDRKAKKIILCILLKSLSLKYLISWPFKALFKDFRNTCIQAFEILYYLSLFQFVTFHMIYIFKSSLRSYLFT